MNAQALKIEEQVRPKKQFALTPYPRTAILHSVPTFTGFHQNDLPPLDVASTTVVENQLVQGSIYLSPNSDHLCIEAAKDQIYLNMAGQIQNAMDACTYTTIGLDYTTAITDSTTALYSVPYSTYADGVSTANITWNVYTDSTAGTVVNGSAYWHPVTTSATGDSYIINTPAYDWKQQIKNLIKSNLLIKVGGNRRALKQGDLKELKARDTLRDMITERDWRRYVTNGFIMVKGASDFSWNGVQGPFWYQVFNDGRRVQVYKDGNHVHSICIHTDKICPPSDHVINIKVLVEIDESQVWSGGNISGGNDRQSQIHNFYLKQKLITGLADQKENLIKHVKRVKNNPGITYNTDGSYALAITGTLAC